MKFFRIILALFLLLCPFWAALPAAAAEGPILGVAQIAEQDWPLYADPETGEVLDYGAAGDWVVVTGEDGPWYQIQYNLQTGYMAQEGLELHQAENIELGWGRVLAASVNLRQGPSTSYAAATTASEGELCYILGVNRGWYKVLCGGEVGYIRSDYLALTEIPYENQASQKSPEFFRNGEALPDGSADLAAALLGSLFGGVDGSVERPRAYMNEMEQTYPGRAALWKGILQNWSAIYREMEVGGGALPTDLPEDASLCIVVFGYALNADGTPRGELLDRLEVALAAAQQYPNAYVLCTGGGTAEASDTTEASVMASWLIDHGVAPERILQEGRSYSTTANAQRSFALLKEYPQIQHVALVSSDYHIRRCALLFGTFSLYQSACAGRKPIDIVATASCEAQSGGGEGLKTQIREIAKVTGLSLS